MRGRRAPTTGPAATLLVWLACAALGGATGGCFGTRSIFSTSPELVGTPAELGLDYEELVFPTADGSRLHGWYLPGHPGRPAVLFLHGNAANISHRLPNLQFLNDLGLSTLIFDYRGFGRSEGWPTRERHLYEDALQALDQLLLRGWQRDQVLYYGRSLGAAVALQLALEAPPAGLVLEAPFTSLADIAWRISPVSYALVGWWAVEAEFDNRAKMPRLSRPLLLFHGDRDPIVPVTMGVELFALAPEPKTFLRIPNGGHSDAFEAGGDAYRRTWLRFIDQVGPDAEPRTPRAASAPRADLQSPANPAL